MKPGPPAIEASTLSLGYRGGGTLVIYYVRHRREKLPTIVSLQRALTFSNGMVNLIFENIILCFRINRTINKHSI